MTTADSGNLDFRERGQAYVAFDDGTFNDAGDEFDRYLSAVRIWGATHCFWYHWPRFRNDELGVWLFARAEPTLEVWAALSRYIDSNGTNLGSSAKPEAPVHPASAETQAPPMLPQVAADVDALDDPDLNDDGLGDDLDDDDLDDDDLDDDDLDDDSNALTAVELERLLERNKIEILKERAAREMLSGISAVIREGKRYGASEAETGRLVDDYMAKYEEQVFRSISPLARVLVRLNDWKFPILILGSFMVAVLLKACGLF